MLYMMEIRSTFTTCFFLFLLLSVPYFSTGASQALESEIYEIDYRGPETHSSSPPPDHHRSHASPLSTHRKGLGSATVNKGLMSSDTHTKQEKVKRIHG
ncbi:uncharacterized protein LOC129307212 [Prosopis cineraria]|uniref:uncharacterized protein LOC129307212 n=1 Tax=Prosopis cineraria TaxID=364024 RepID=UPI00240FF74C|nr:uncharacterized protein LOC129307212 [Prosopis cineraria]